MYFTRNTLTLAFSYQNREISFAIIKMVKLIFSFSNVEQRLELELSPSLSVSEVKKILRGDKWPDFQVEREKVDRLRLICMGHEMEDSRPLGKFKNRMPEYPLAVLVHIIKVQFGLSPPKHAECCGTCNIM